AAGGIPRLVIEAKLPERPPIPKSARREYESFVRHLDRYCSRSEEQTCTDALSRLEVQILEKAHCMIARILERRRAAPTTVDFQYGGDLITDGESPSHRTESLEEFAGHAVPS